LAGSVTKNVTKLSFASEEMQAAERSQLRSRLLSSDDFNHRRGVVMSITISITAVQSHTPDDDADEMSKVVDIVVEHVVDIDLCGRRPPLLSKAPRISSWLLTDWNYLLLDSQSLCSYSVEQITVVHKY